MHKLYRVLLFPVYLCLLVIQKKLFVVCLDPTVHRLSKDDLEDLSGLCPSETVVANGFTSTGSPRCLLALRENRACVVIIGFDRVGRYDPPEQLVHQYQTLAMLPRNKRLPRLKGAEMLGLGSITFAADKDSQGQIEWSAEIKPGSVRHWNSEALISRGDALRKELGLHSLLIHRDDDPADFHGYL